jgi:hypothetical protein
MTDLKISDAEQRGPARADTVAQPSPNPRAHARIPLVTGMHGAFIVRCLKEH